MTIEHDIKSCLNDKGEKIMNYGEGRTLIELISSIATLIIYGVAVGLGLYYEYIVITENSIYIVSNEIPTRKIS